MNAEKGQMKIPSRYYLKKDIKKGALGHLFLGYDQKLNNDVLFKITSPWMSADKGFKSYIYDKWAEKGTLFEHPNIAGIIDINKMEGSECYYIVTEYPGGKTLAEELKDAPIDPERSIELLHQIAEALRALHRKDIVDAHLKPSDIYITADQAGKETIKVLLVDMDVDLEETAGTLIGESYGRPKYRAPEVIKGRQPSPQSDIFALGIIGFEMLTGKEPFPSDNPYGYFFTNCETDPEIPHHLITSLPHELSMTILRCLEKMPSKRYRKIQRVIDDLDRCAAVVQTGICEVVPRGTDSALARDYELPVHNEKDSKSTSRLAYAAFFLALAAAIFTAGVHLPALQNAGKRLLESSSVPENAREEAEKNVQESERRPDRPDRDAVFDERFQQTLTRWQRSYRRSADYQRGIDEFIALAEDGEEPQSERALEMAAKIYAEWAQSLTSNQNWQEAKQKYEKSANIAPAGSGYETVYRDNLPHLIQSRINEAFENDEYEKAERLIGELKEKFPNTTETQQTSVLLPVIHLKKAQQKIEAAEWQEAGKILEYIVHEFPESEEAGKAQRELLPNTHLKKAQEALDDENFESASKHIEIIKEKYPESPAFNKTPKMAAALLFVKYIQHIEAEDTENASTQLKQLHTEFPDSDQAYRAARLQAGLQPVDGEKFLPPSEAEDSLLEAENQMQAGQFTDAIELLEKIITKTEPGSHEGRQALELLPKSLYEEALRQFGSQVDFDLENPLRKITRQFPLSLWAERAETTLREYENTPDGMVYIPEGNFVMGADKEEIRQQMKPFYPERVLESENELNLIFQLEGYASEMPAHSAQTGSFYMQKTPVTNKQYYKFINETEHRAPEHWEETAFPEGQEDFPVVNITISDAQAYAEWAGKRLPTEREWEKGARGTDGRFFPWGNTFEENRAHHLEDPMAGPETVGKYAEGISPYGVLDMIGNVCEWTTSYFKPFEGNQLFDHRAPYGDDFLVTRGGSWEAHDIQGVPSSVTRRFPRAPGEPAMYIGFRCVKDIDE